MNVIPIVVFGITLSVYCKCLLHSCKFIIIIHISIWIISEKVNPFSRLLWEEERSRDGEEIYSSPASLQTSHTTYSGTTMQENQLAAQITARHNIFLQMAPYMSWIFLLLAGIDPGVYHLGRDIVSHNTTDALQSHSTPPSTIFTGTYTLRVLSIVFLFFLCTQACGKYEYSKGHFPTQPFI